MVRTVSKQCIQETLLVTLCGSNVYREQCWSPCVEAMDI